MIFKQWFCYSVPYFWWLLYLVSDSFLCFPSVNFRSQTNLPRGSWQGFKFSQLNYLLSWASSRHSHWNSAVKYIDNTIILRQIQNFSACLAMHQQKTVKTQQKLLYIMPTMASAYLNILLKTMIWFFKSWDYLFYLYYISYCLLITHLNGWNGRQYSSRWSPCFDFFGCPCYSMRTHYQPLGKPGAQNSSVWERK